MMKAYSMDEQLSPTKLMNAGLSLSLTHTYIYIGRRKKIRLESDAFRTIVNECRTREATDLSL